MFVSYHAHHDRLLIHIQAFFQQKHFKNSSLLTFSSFIFTLCTMETAHDFLWCPPVNMGDMDELATETGIEFSQETKDALKALNIEDFDWNRMTKGDEFEENLKRNSEELLLSVDGSLGNLVEVESKFEATLPRGNSLEMFRRFIQKSVSEEKKEEDVSDCESCATTVVQESETEDANDTCSETDVDSVYAETEEFNENETTIKDSELDALPDEEPIKDSCDEEAPEDVGLITIQCQGCFHLFSEVNEDGKCEGCVQKSVREQEEETEAEFETESESEEEEEVIPLCRKRKFTDRVVTPKAKKFKGSTRHTCHVCDKSFSSPQALKIHIMCKSGHGCMHNFGHDYRWRPVYDENNEVVAEYEFIPPNFDPLYNKCEICEEVGFLKGGLNRRWLQNHYNRHHKGQAIPKPMPRPKHKCDVKPFLIIYGQLPKGFRPKLYRTFPPEVTKEMYQSWLKRNYIKWINGDSDCEEPPVRIAKPIQEQNHYQCAPKIASV